MQRSIDETMMQETVDPVDEAIGKQYEEDDGKDDAKPT